MKTATLESKKRNEKPKNNQVVTLPADLQKIQGDIFLDESKK
jgi:hypothetical protein